MGGFDQYFPWPDVRLEYYFIYFGIAFLIALYLVFKSDTRYKFELFFISFYLLTGNLNKILTLKLPGFGLFEIKPIRLVFLLLAFLIIRKTLFAKNGSLNKKSREVPVFLLALFGYIGFLILSVMVNSPDMELQDVLLEIFNAMAFLVLIYGISLMRDKASYNLIGRAIIIGAAASSLVSILQLAIDPYFLRIGDQRLAFGTVLRSNGLFSTEYFNSYFLIIAMTWTLIMVKRQNLKFVLVSLFAIGILTSFQRMSWIIMALVLFTYLVYIRKLGADKLILIGLSGLTLVLVITTLFYQDIMRSSLVQERLADTVGGRAGYYTLVLDNVDKRPLFGHGDLKNEIYYQRILQITSSRERASAESGDLHSGYFSALYLFGIPAFVCFVVFTIMAVAYYAKLYKENLYFAIPFLVGIIYLVGNLTNTFLFLKYISILFAIHIGIGMGLKRMKNSDSGLII